MTITVGTIVSLVIVLIFLAILVLVGRWLIATMGLGEPWPTVLILVIVAILLLVLANIFFGTGFRITSSYGEIARLVT